MNPFPWQQIQWEQVTRQCTTQWMPNSFLLMGAEGLGKTAFAAALAQWLLCEARVDSLGSACGACRSCRLMESRTHPDFFSLVPSEGQSVIQIDSVRYLIDSLRQTSVQSRYQVVLIEPVEAMNIASSHALLKTLEEPPGSVVFILISHHPNQVLSTIKSRAQPIHFFSPALDNAASWLKNHIPPGQVDVLLSIAGGVPLKALALSKQTDLLKAREQLFESLSQVATGHLHPIQAAQNMSKCDLSRLLADWFSMMVDLMALVAKASVEHLVSQDKKEFLMSLAGRISLRSLIYFQHHFRETIQTYSIHSNLNPTLLLEYLLIEWRKMCT